MTHDLSAPTREPIDWQQPFRWGILTAFAEDPDFELAPAFEQHTVSWGKDCFTVIVQHSQDPEVPEGWHDDVWPPNAVHIAVAFTPASEDNRIDYEGSILCESGRLAIGDAENEKVVDVPTGELKIQVTLFPHEDAKAVILRIFSEKV